MQPGSLPLAANVTIAIFCALGSAIFSGLTLGLLTLDCVQLKMLIDQPDKNVRELKAAKYARRILPIRQDGNYLLVTLLLGNVAVNSAFTIVLGSLVSEYVALVLSVTVITLFGEILPQALCARHGLVVGGWFTPLVLVLEWILFPIVKPIAMVLNKALGEEIGSIYSRNQLKALVHHHHLEAKVITRDEARILAGGLEAACKSVSEIMTPLNNVVGLEIGGNLSDPTAAAVLDAGYSRIPVFDYTKKECTVGLVLLRDLVLWNPPADTPIESIVTKIGRRMYTVDADANVLTVLSEFKKGHTHLAVVRRIVTETELDPYYQHIGIVTLEDIIEEILQDEIYDEYEAPVETASMYGTKEAPENVLHKETTYQAQQIELKKTPSGGLPNRADKVKRILFGEYHAMRPHSRTALIKGKPYVFDESCLLIPSQEPIPSLPKSETYHPLVRLRLQDRRRGIEKLSYSEACTLLDIFQNLKSLVKLPHDDLVHFLMCQELKSYSLGYKLYTSGSPAIHSTLILNGGVTVICGSEHFKVDLRPWDHLCLQLLDTTSEEPVICDFDAVVSEDMTRVLSLSRESLLLFG